MGLFDDISFYDEEKIQKSMDAQPDDAPGEEERVEGSLILPYEMFTSFIENEPKGDGLKDLLAYMRYSIADLGSVEENELGIIIRVNDDRDMPKALASIGLLEPIEEYV